MNPKNQNGGFGTRRDNALRDEYDGCIVNRRRGKKDRRHVPHKTLRTGVTLWAVLHVRTHL